ncbi:hypothetical protein GCM10010469_20070 [Streptomyces labedae]|uniref:Uncharacterized protein n=1 Tax=Streptomyces labedae TaxID=285569 RepID=A0ABP6QU58_9ACTN
MGVGPDADPDVDADSGAGADPGAGAGSGAGAGAGSGAGVVRVSSVPSRDSVWSMPPFPSSSDVGGEDEGNGRCGCAYGFMITKGHVGVYGASEQAEQRLRRVREAGVGPGQRQFEPHRLAPGRTA